VQGQGLGWVARPRSRPRHQTERPRSKPKMLLLRLNITDWSGKLIQMMSSCHRNVISPMSSIIKWFTVFCRNFKDTRCRKSHISHQSQPRPRVPRANITDVEIPFCGIPHVTIIMFCTFINPAFMTISIITLLMAKHSVSKAA